MVNLNLVTNIYPFNQLSKNDLNSLIRIMKVSSFRKGKYIGYQGDKADNFHFVLDGVVSLYRWVNDEKEVLIKDAIIGEWINLNESINKELIYYDSRVKVDATLVSFSKSSLDSLFGNPIINKSIVHSLSRWNSFYYKMNSFSTCYSSLMDFIKKSNSREVIITQSKLSEILGYTRESINKNLRRMEDEGKIKLERGKILIQEHSSPS